MIRIRAIRHLREELGEILQRNRIESAHRAAEIEQLLHDVKRRSFPNVVGFRLERHAENANRFSRHISIQHLDNFLQAMFALLLVHLDNGVNNLKFHAVRSGDFGQCLRIFRKARPAVAGAGMQEFRADPAIQAHPFGDMMHIRANALAEIRNFVDKRNFRR